VRSSRNVGGCPPFLFTPEGGFFAGDVPRGKDSLQVVSAGIRVNIYHLTAEIKFIDKALTRSRLKMVEAARIVLERTLALIGMGASEQM
jgi:hypothetical protein